MRALIVRGPFTLLLVAGLLALLAAGCDSDDGGEGAAGTPATGTTDSIVVGSYSEPLTLDPQKADDDAGYAVFWRLYESLYDSDAKGNLRPVLATKPPRQIDATTWEIKLRKGVTFHGGEAFNADAAVFSIERIIDPDYGTENREVIGITGAQKVDDSTIRVTTKEQDFLLPRRLETILMVPDGAKDLDKKAKGTGPYKLKSYDSASQAVLTANPDYWGPAPSIQDVTVKFIADPGTRLQALQAGELDLALNLSPDQVEQTPEVIDLKLATQTSFVRLNTLADGPLQDRRVREALNIAIDREGLAENLYAGYAEPATCQMGVPWVGGRSDDLKEIPYDPERAKRLIAEAGATGEAITLVWTSNVFPMDRPVGQAVAQAWEAAGLKVDLKLLPYNAAVKVIFTKGTDVEDATFFETSSGLAHAERQISSALYTDEGVSAYSNPEIDKLRRRALGTRDEAERAKAYEEINRIGCDDWAGVFLLYRKEILGAAEGLEYTPRPPISTKLYYDDLTADG